MSSTFTLTLKPGRLELVARANLFAAAVMAFMALGVSGAGLIASRTRHADNDLQYQGTELGERQAPGFRLKDQNGTELSLSDLQGKIVVLAFLDPKCTESCPLTAFYFHLTNQSLGEQSYKVVFLAVNVNKKAISVADIAEATERWGMSQLANWHFLSGSQQELRPVWEAYNIVAEGGPKPGKPDEEQHTSGVYLINEQGKLRRYISIPFGAPSFRPLNEVLVEQLQDLLNGQGSFPHR